jgi:hypothetical protein
MGGLSLSCDSRGGKFRERPYFPAIPAAPIRGGGNGNGIGIGNDLLTNLEGTSTWHQ